MGGKVAPEDMWRTVLVDGHGQLLRWQRIFRLIPSAPRCKMCHNPFGGLGGKLVGLAGFRPSRKNPSLCSKCCDVLPVGGVELDIAVLFADVRGSTRIGEQSSASAFAELMNRFYKVATESLVRHDAIIDKLIGDEVMALFIPGVAGPDYRRRAVEAAVDLLRATGVGSPEGPWLDVAASVNAGTAYVGNVGDAVVDFTALGDPVNVAARMQAQALAGQVLVAEDVDPFVPASFPEAERRVLTLRGHDGTVPALVLQP
jgi:adenylate cyclase